VLVLGSKP